MLEETRDKLLARNAQAVGAKNIEDAKEDRDAKKAEGAGDAAKGGGGKEEGAGDAAKGGGGKEEGAGDAAKGGGGKEEGAGDAAKGGGGKEEGAEDAGAAGSAECIACLIAAGLAPAGEWHAGRDSASRPGRRGWRQRRLPPRCKCRGECTTSGGRKRNRQDCKCEPGRQCRCACCEPLAPPPFGPPHARGCPAPATSPLHSLTPEEFGAEIEGDGRELL